MNNNFEMDMPTPCTHCGDIFDLNDGYGSDKWYPNIVICENCYNKEQEEIEEDERWENINTELTNALYSLNQEKDINSRLSAENREQIRKIAALLPDKQEITAYGPDEQPVRTTGVAVHNTRLIVEHPDHFGLRFRPLKECFVQCAEVTSTKALHHHYTSYINLILDETLFFGVMRDVFPDAVAEDSSGELGFFLKFDNPS